MGSRAKGGIDMVISISLSESDLQRIKDALGIDTYDDIHKAFIDAMDHLLSNEEENKEG